MYRLLLSCASSQVYADLFQPGRFALSEATERAARLAPSLGGVEVCVVPEIADPRAVLVEKGWV